MIKLVILLLPVTLVLGGSNYGITKFYGYSIFKQKHNETIKDVPYMAQILYKGNYVCGGCIRGREWILTAAHCFDNRLNPTDYTVLTGTSYKTGYDGESHRVHKIILHYNYSPKDMDARNDLALVQLERPMKFSEVQHSIKVRDLFLNVNYVKVSAFGLNEISLVSDLPVIKSMIVPVTDSSDCLYHYGKGVDGNMFCAGTIEDHACEGDSGNPVVDNLGKLVGIVSRGHDCDLASAPSVYVKVPHYISWLDEKTKIPSLYS